MRIEPQRTLRKSHYKLWVVDSFSGSGIGEIALAMALRSIATRGVTFEIMGGIAAEKDPLANQFRKRLLEALPATYQDHIGKLRVIPDVKGLRSELHNLRIPAGHVILHLEGSPCDVISRGTLENGEDDKRVGLHSPPSNIFFSYYDEISGYKKDRPDLCHLMCGEQVVGFHPQDKIDIEKRLGKAIPVSAHRWGGATRERWYFTQPPLDSVVPTHFNDVERPSPVHRWPTSEAKDMKVPPVITAYYPTRSRKVLHGGATPYELKNFKSHKVLDNHTGTRVTAKPIVLAHWLGWPEDIVDILYLLHTCQNRFHKYTFRPKSQYNNNTTIQPPDNTFTTCGEPALCDPCSEMATILGKSWHVGAAADVLEQLLMEFSQMTSLEVTQFQHTTFPYQLRHTCPKNCGLGLTKKTACQKYGTWKQRQERAKTFPQDVPNTPPEPTE